MMAPYLLMDPYCRSITDIQVQYEFDGEAHPGRLIRLSLEGLLMDTPIPPPVGSVISVAFMGGAGFELPCGLTALAQALAPADRSVAAERKLAGEVCLSATVLWRWHLAFAARWGLLASTQVRGLDTFILALSPAAFGLDGRDEESLC